MPDELDVGGFNATGASPTAASIGAKVPIVGMAPNTRITIFAEPCVHIDVAF